MFTAYKQLILHACLVLVFGLGLGAPYARAIRNNAPAHIVNSWRVAHLSLPIGAVLMFVVGLLLAHMQTTSLAAWVIAILLIISAYSFCVATPLAALSGQRGLNSNACGTGRIVYLANVLGAITSLLGAVCLFFCVVAWCWQSP